MGPLYSFYCALAGFFAFAAIYHLILWSSQRKLLLAVFSIDCGLLGLMSGVLSTLIVAQTPEAAENALWARISIGALMMVTWLWSMSLVAGVQAHWFVWPLTAAFLVVFAVNTFVYPLNSHVLSVDHLATPWGEIISNPRLGTAGSWYQILFVLVIANYLFSFTCGVHIWQRDHFIGTLILLIGCGLIMNNLVLESLRVARSFNYPAYLGVIVQVTWVCVVAMLIARDYRQAMDSSAVSEQRFRLLFEGASDAIFLADAETGLLIDCNLAAETLLGRERAEIIGQPQTFLHPPDAADKNRETFRAHASLEVTANIEQEVLRKDGRRVVVSIAPSVTTIGSQKVIQGIFRDISERKRIDAELWTSRQRLEVLSRQLITTQETERRHLARELHDEIGQVLTAIKMNLRRTQRAANADVKLHLDENVAMVDQAIVQVRNLALSLRPAQLDELGLAAALHWLLNHQAELGGFEDLLEVNLGEIEIPAELQTVCFRIAQEALTNAVRHGKPTKVHIKLWANNDEVCLSVRDDGIGFDVGDIRRRAEKGSSFGLTSMQERASLVGGQLKIESSPGHGTTIYACCPLTRASV